MAYTNSPLATVRMISPNHSGERNHAIDTITIHCTCGQGTAEAIGKIFQPVSRQASSNYGIGYDGSIGLYVEEKNRSWCSSSGTNDHRAITIEVSSEKEAPYAVTEKAYSALIDLLVDICQRNGIKALLWRGDKSLIGQVDKQNMTVHRWFANKSCPGEYLYERHGAIADEVNKRLSGSEEKTLYRVQIGAYTVKANAEKQLAKAKAAGFADAFIAEEKIEGKTEAKPASVPKKTIDQVAMEVVQGKWGIGSERKQKLEQAGYDYQAVQKKVNEIMK